MLNLIRVFFSSFFWVSWTWDIRFQVRGQIFELQLLLTVLLTSLYGFNVGIVYIGMPYYIYCIYICSRQVKHSRSVWFTNMHLTIRLAVHIPSFLKHEFFYIFWQLELCPNHISGDILVHFSSCVSCSYFNLINVLFIICRFLVLSTSIVYGYYTYVLKIDGEDFGGHGALLQEGLFASFTLFLVRFIDHCFSQLLSDSPISSVMAFRCHMISVILRSKGDNSLIQQCLVGCSSHGLSYTVYCIFEDSHVHTSLWNLDNFLSSLMPHGFGIGGIGILLVSLSIKNCMDRCAKMHHFLAWYSWCGVMGCRPLTFMFYYARRLWFRAVIRCRSI